MMTRYDDLIKALRAAAYEHGEAALAREIDVSDDTVRRMLSGDPPKVMQNLQALEAAAARLDAKRS
jgi:acetolactate synthase small subunit